MSGENKNDKIKGLAVLIVLSLAFWVGCNTCGDKEKEKPASVAEAPKMPTSTEAYYMAHVFVRRLLKAPATAEFPTADEAKIWADADSTFIIKGFVDAQNSYRALLRTNYYAKIKYLGDDKWEPIKVNLEE